MNDRSGLRLIILGVLVFSLPITLLGRLWYMQALAGSQYVADGERERDERGENACSSGCDC